MSHFNSLLLAEVALKSIQGGEILEEYSGKEACGVLTDVVTQWWSTLCMCDRILYLKPALTHLLVSAFPIKKKAR